MLRKLDPAAEWWVVTSRNYDCSLSPSLRSWTLRRPLFAELACDPKFEMPRPNGAQSIHSLQPSQSRLQNHGPPP
eukprot:1997050-Amphidinium_carterae.1